MNNSKNKKILTDQHASPAEKQSAAVDLAKIFEKNPDLTPEEIEILAFRWGKLAGVPLPKDKQWFTWFFTLYV